MQRSGTQTPSTQTAAPFFSSLFGGGGGSNSNAPNSNTKNEPSSSWSPHRKSPGRSRPPSSSGEQHGGGGGGGDTGASPRQHNVLHKNRDRRPSFSRKPSFSIISSSSPKHRTVSSSSANGAPGPPPQRPPPPAIQLFSDSPVPPLPDLSLSAAALNKLSSKEIEPAIQSPASVESFSKMLSRTAPTPVNGYSAASSSQLAPPPVLHSNPTTSSSSQPTELSIIHQHIQETAQKRISTLDYLRKAYAHHPPPSPSPSHLLPTNIRILGTKAASTGSTRSSSTNPTSNECPTSSTPGN